MAVTIYERDNCGLRYENNVIAALFSNVYRLTIFEFTEFRVYYLLPDFYCLRLNPVEATEVGGGGGQKSGTMS